MNNKTTFLSLYEVSIVVLIDFIAILLPPGIFLIQIVKGTVPAENIFFIISFYAIMHRTTIVQNKIISSICSCLFFVQLIFISLV